MRLKRCGFDLWVRKIPLEEGMETLFLPEESNGFSNILAWYNHFDSPKNTDYRLSLKYHNLFNQSLSECIHN